VYNPSGVKARRAAIEREAVDSGTSGRRLRRLDRRDQLLAAATRAFARNGFEATNLEDVAREAGISKVLLYRHFDSKADLYRAVLDRSMAHLATSVGEGEFTMESVGALLRAAAEDPDGFRLLFHHAAREPEFRADMDRLRAGSVAIARRQLAGRIPDRAWARWAAQLAPTVAVDAVIAWLDAGQPDPEKAAARIGRVLAAIVKAAQRG
jgi:AcrR family transcriptional regulator